MQVSTIECDCNIGTDDQTTDSAGAIRQRKMDPRGPPEGAPAESFEISSIDRGADISVNWPMDHPFASSLCEQPKKLNNRLLFLTVSNSSTQHTLSEKTSLSRSLGCRTSS